MDEWFDSIASAVGLIGRQRQAVGEPAGAVEPVPEPVPVPAPEPEPVAEPAPSKLDLTKPARPEPTPAPAAAPALVPPPATPVPTPHVGSRPPTYGPEPTLLPAADLERVAAVVPDTALDGAQYPGLTLRAASVRGDSARYRGDPRTDALLVTRFGEARTACCSPSSAAAPAARSTRAPTPTPPLRSPYRRRPKPSARRPRTSPRRSVAAAPSSPPTCARGPGTGSATDSSA